MSKDLYDKDQDESLFRLAIFGTGDEGRALYSMFESDICNVKISDDIKELVNWKPHSIFLTGLEGEEAFHGAIQNTDVAVTLFNSNMTMQTLFTVVEDYDHANVKDRMTLVYNVSPTVQVWGGSPISQENLGCLIGNFSRSRVEGVEMTPPEAIYLKDSITNLKDDMKKFFDEVRKNSLEHDLSPNKSARLVKEVAFTFDPEE